MDIYTGKTFYFWNKKLYTISSTVVDEVSSDSLIFTYNHRSYKCALSYAKGKIFSCPDDVITPWGRFGKLEDHVRWNIWNGYHPFDSSLNFENPFDC